MQESVMKKSPAFTVIDSLIDDKRKVASGQWLLSIVKSKGKEHAFLLLEGKIKNEFVIFRTDLFLRKDTDQTLFGQNVRRGSVLDRLFECSASSRGRAFVNVTQLSVSDYDEIILSTEFQGWVIEVSQAEKLLKRFQEEGQKNYNYHSGGDSSGFSVSDSRSTRTSCITWCEKILKEVLGLSLASEWHLVKIPSSRVALAKQCSQKSGQQQISSLNPSNQRLESVARMNADDNAKYFKSFDNTNLPHSVLDPTTRFFPDTSFISIVRGNKKGTQNQIFLILESIEQQSYTLRRIDLVTAAPMEMMCGSQQQSIDALVKVQSMHGEYSIECVKVSAKQGDDLRVKIEEENQRRLSTSSTTSRAKIGLFDGPSPLLAFLTSLKSYFDSNKFNTLSEGIKL